MVNWTIVTFGKYKGNTLPQIVIKDPDWFFFAFEKQFFKGDLKSEAELINDRARRIRIPHEGSTKLVAEYIVHPSTNKLADLQFVPEDRPMHAGSSRSFRRDHIDLSAARSFSAYDKSGGKILVQKMKQLLFRDPAYRLTRKRCEELFDNDQNFNTL